MTPYDSFANELPAPQRLAIAARWAEQEMQAVADGERGEQARRELMEFLEQRMPRQEMERVA